MNKVEKLLEKWANTPAEWYHFWLPRSGIIGGVIVAIVLHMGFYIIKWSFQ